MRYKLSGNNEFNNYFYKAMKNVKIKIISQKKFLGKFFGLGHNKQNKLSLEIIIT